MMSEKWSLTNLRVPFIHVKNDHFPQPHETISGGLFRMQKKLEKLQGS